MTFNDRDYYCPVCGGWLESVDQCEDYIFICDTCEYCVNIITGEQIKTDKEQNK
jgi:hypothetical protein